MHCISRLVSCFCMSCTLCLALFFTSSLIGFLFSLVYKRSAHFALYIVTFYQQLYIEVAAKWYRCLVWRYQISLIFCFYLVFYALRLLPYLLPFLLLCLSLCLLLSFRSLLGGIDLFVFISTFSILINICMLR